MLIAFAFLFGCLGCAIGLTAGFTMGLTVKQGVSEAEKSIHIGGKIAVTK